MSNSIVSVSQAADLVRRDRQTLYNHRKQGKLSFVRREDDSFGVDTAELQRVYGKLYVTAEEIAEANDSAAPATSSAMVTELRHQLELKQKDLEIAKNDAEHWEGRAVEAAASIKLIEHQKSELTEQADSWRQALSDRKNEIDQARAEAAELRERERAQADALKAEKARVAALQSRGLIARLFNKKVEPEFSD